MITTIDDETANQNIFPVFRPVFKLIRKNYIQPTENIFAVVCCTVMNQYHDSQASGWRMGHMPSIVVLSGHRWIRASFKSFSIYSTHHKEITYHKSGFGLGALFGGDFLDWKWIEITKPDGLRSRKEDDDIQKDIFIHETLLSTVQVKRRFDYTVNFENKPLSLVEISFPRNIDIVFRESDGNRIYALLQEAIKNNGHIQIVHENHPNDPIESLKKLKELLELGLISETEYELKKQEILAKL